MKNSFIFGVILLLLTLVGYKAYKDASVLKPITTYEECLKARGSITQELDPSTCITRSNVRFTEPVAIEELVPLDITNWKTFSNKKYSFKYPKDGVISQVDGLVVLSYAHHEGGNLKLTFNHHLPSKQSLEEYITENYLPNAHGNVTMAPLEQIEIGDHTGYQATIWAVDAGGYGYFIFESKDKKQVMDVTHYAFEDMLYADPVPVETINSSNIERQVLKEIISSFKFTN